MIIRDSQLLLRADHALGNDPADLSRLQRHGFCSMTVYQSRSYAGKSHPLTGSDIGGTTNDGDPLNAKVNCDQRKTVSLRMTIYSCHFPYNHILPGVTHSLYAVDFQASHGESLG